MNLEALEKLPRLPLSEIYDLEGAKVALFEGNNTAIVGRLKTVAARTRGNTTLAITGGQVIQRNGRVFRHRRTPIWVYRHGWKERGFAILEAAEQGSGER